MRRRGAAALLLVAIVLPACDRGGEPKADIKLDGSARFPDRAGVVGKVSLERITIDGKEAELSRNLQSFSTYTLTALPVLNTRGAYVHAGVEDGEVVWIALVAKLLSVPPAAPEAFYKGTFARAQGRNLVFRDGTVFAAAPGLEPPTVGFQVLAEIDVANDRIVRLTDG